MSDRYSFILMLIVITALVTAMLLFQDQERCNRLKVSPTAYQECISK